MKEFTRIRFDRDECLRNLEEFRALLEGKEELEEGADIKPFFDARPQLVALIASTYASETLFCDLVAPQYQLFGDFGCDVVAGNSKKRVFGFIEWEDASVTSLFRRQGQKATPEWSTRVERGFSQILDWFWKLADMASTDEFQVRFGSRHANYFGLLVIGRDAFLAHAREQSRWEWRSRRVSIDGRPVRLATYDQVCRDAAMFFDHYFADEESE